MKNFNNWLNTLIEEKGINTENEFELEGPSGTNFMSYAVIIENIKAAPSNEQAQIKNVLVAIDFKNGDICHFFRHLGKAIVK